MSVERLTLDSNILFYTIDADAGELQEKARDVVRQAARSDCFLSLQTLSEFFASTTRKGKLTAVEASAHVEDLQTLFPIVAATAWKPASRNASRPATQPFLLGCHAVGRCKAGWGDAAAE
jgi:predicted nucleic acid-binding protein